MANIWNILDPIIFAISILGIYVIVFYVFIDDDDDDWNLPDNKKYAKDKT
tara:strand:+ start:1609 stop:1758 length:150 start_codon:yes stop_codon:yes gene_type:complete